MPKTLLFVIVLAVILATVIATLYLNRSDRLLPSKIEIDTAVNQAKYLYAQEKMRGRDFSNGPCLSEALLPDWVVDIVHNPRLPVDDLPENQCSGDASKHFVELDTNGDLVRVK